MSLLKDSEFYISKRMGRAIMDYRMISEGDKIAVAVSGGKDSMALLRLLIDRKKFVPVKYEIVAIHIDQGYPKSIAVKLAKEFKKLKVKYLIKKIDILKKTPKKDINCFWCAWNRRKALFEASYKLGCTKVALGHHMDDVIETILLNLFFQGEISAMMPYQKLFKGKIKLIRPLAYVEKRLIKRFVKEEKITHDTCVCPHSETSKRAMMGKIIAGIEKACPDVKKNIFRSVKRIKSEYLL